MIDVGSDEPVDVGTFAATINARLRADSRICGAVAFAWSAGGMAIGSCLIGLGVAFACYGYSYMISVRPAAEQTAKALVDALEHSNFKTTVSGLMSIDPDTQLRLAPGQAIRLEEGSIVKLDPSSSVRVVGDLKVDMPQPSQEQLQLQIPGKNNELPFTSYTIFRSVPYASGEVVTGWSFDLSDVLRPKTQYCYYAQSVDKGLSAKYTIAFNGAPQRPSPLAKLSFEFDGALTNCIWFSGA
jgi:hypothetical protein